jgi:hypothetical protein
MLFEQVNDCKELAKFLQCEKWKIFSLGKVYLEFVTQYPKRNIVVDK